MQQTSWPVNRILQLNFKIQICFSYHDNDNYVTLHWRCGCIQSNVHEKSEINNTIEVKVLWDDKYEKVGGINSTKELLKKKLYKTDIHVNGSCWKDLRHLMTTWNSQWTMTLINTYLVLSINKQILITRLLGRLMIVITSQIQ